jgi:hypothetical protein
MRQVSLYIDHNVTHEPQMPSAEQSCIMECEFEDEYRCKYYIIPPGSHFS